MFTFIFILWLHYYTVQYIFVAKLTGHVDVTNIKSTACNKAVMHITRNKYKKHQKPSRKIIIMPPDNIYGYKCYVFLEDTIFNMPDKPAP
jgi:hypothetical protein